MATVDVESEFLQFNLSPEEMIRACKFQDPFLTLLYFRNMLHDVMMQMCNLEFTPEKKELSLVQHVHLSGQRDILQAIIAAYQTPVPVPGQEQESQLSSQPGA